MTIKERISRFNDEDIVVIGSIFSNFRGTEMYDLLSYVTEQQIMAELSDIGNKENSEKRLGRLEGIRLVMVALENYEMFKEQVLARRREEEKEKTPMEEPQIKSGGGGGI
jgi:hypothetical protein